MNPDQNNQNPQPAPNSPPDQNPPAPSAQPSTPPDQNPSDPKSDTFALLSLISGILVLAYHGWIAIVQPARIEIYWYVIILPVILGVLGLKSKKRKPLAIAGLALGAISIGIFVFLFSTIYTFE